MRPKLSNYAIVLNVLVAAVALRLIVDPFLGNSAALVTLFGAVAAAVYFGGYRAAVLVAAFGYVACHLLFLEPRGVFDLSTAKDIVGLSAYIVSCAMIVGIGEAMRRARDQASQRGELLYVTLASIGDAVITTDPDCRVTFLNAAAEELIGWTNREAVGHPLDRVFRLVHETSGDPLESPAARALRENKAVLLPPNAAVITKDGTRRPVDDSASPIHDRNGNLVGCVIVFRDLSAQRSWEREQAQAQESTRLLAAIVASSDDAIMSKSLDGTIQSWNAAAERLFGYSEADALGANVSLIVPSTKLEEEARLIADLRAGGRYEHFETERLHRNGRTLPVALTISPLRDPEGNVVGASTIARDMTDRKRVEAERHKFVTLVENSTSFIGMYDPAGVPFYINRAGLEMAGLPNMDEARRTRLPDFFHPQDQAGVIDLFSAVVEHGHAETEVRFRNFRTGATRWVGYKVINLTDESGRRIGFATVCQDISERRRLEDSLRSLAADLSEADRRKDEFLATLAHELRNPLQPLSNAVHLLIRAPGDANIARQTVDIMDRQVKQLVRLVDDLLDVSRIKHGRLELRKGKVPLQAVIEQAVQACAPLAESAGHQVHVTMPHDPVYLHADSARLIQVFANLLNNSCKYTCPGGTIKVSMERRGNYAEASIEDNGIGIAHDKLQTIFEPFMQVEDARGRSRGGLGIGLTLVSRLVHMHGGSVEATSPGSARGSKFTVRLPITVSTSDADEAISTPGAAQPPSQPTTPEALSLSMSLAA